MIAGARLALPQRLFHGRCGSGYCGDIIFQAGSKLSLHAENILDFRLCVA